MDILIFQNTKNGKWGIQVSTTMGASTGRTIYETQEEAIANAQQQYPGCKITIEQ